MPGFARKRNVKTHARKKLRYRSATNRNLSKHRAKRIVRSKPTSSPNVYHFSRGFDSYADVGDVTGIFDRNPTSHYAVINLRTKFSDLADYDNFRYLFAEYKIHSFTVKLVPSFSNNFMPTYDPVTAALKTSIVPNYEVFALPVNYCDDEHDFVNMSTTDIDKFLNISQRKSVRMVPNKIQTFHTPRPKVPGWKGGPNKTGGISSVAMIDPYWMSTIPPPTGNLDERNIYHYGMKLLIRRVDGDVIHTNAENHFAFRVEHSVNFSCRKVTMLLPDPA